MAGCGGYSYLANRTEPVPDGSCKTPFAVTEVLKGDPNVSPPELYSGLGRGVVVVTELKPGTKGVIGAFKDPGSPDSDWKESGMMPVDESQKEQNARYGIGRGNVVIGTSLVLSKDSSECNNPPTIKVVDGNRFDGPSVVPWPGANSVVIEADNFANLLKGIFK